MAHTYTQRPYCVGQHDTSRYTHAANCHCLTRHCRHSGLRFGMWLRNTHTHTHTHTHTDLIDDSNKQKWHKGGNETNILIVPQLTPSVKYSTFKTEELKGGGEGGRWTEKWDWWRKQCSDFVVGGGNGNIDRRPMNSHGSAAAGGTIQRSFS